MREDWDMNTTIMNYPGFHTLPKGIKQLLLVSETHFFNEAAPQCMEQKDTAHASRTDRRFNAVPPRCAARSFGLAKALPVFPAGRFHATALAYPVTP
jgi:hypothetical protein